MDYRIEFSQTAKKELNELEKDTAIRILKKLREIVKQPFTHIKRLSGSQLFSLRVGDYRILMIVIEDKILVTRLGHRKNVYDS